MNLSHPEHLPRVFIVEDHKLVRQVMGKLIQRADGIVLCGEADSAEDALEKIPDCQPQLVLVDVSLPGINGIELIQILHGKYPEMKFLALSAHDESVYGAMAIRAGAHGYIMKDKVGQVLDAISEVTEGRLFISDTLQTILGDSK
jgi:DNA-binding NarL/FixJ family response regulator